MTTHTDKSTPALHWEPWSPENDTTLIQGRAANVPFKELAAQLGRTEAACSARFKLLREQGVVPPLLPPEPAGRDELPTMEEQAGLAEPPADEAYEAFRALIARETGLMADVALLLSEVPFEERERVCYLLESLSPGLWEAVGGLIRVLDGVAEEVRRRALAWAREFLS